VPVSGAAPLIHMDAQTKKLYDRLVKAEWVENVRDTESQHQAGVREHELTWLKTSNPLEHGEYKMMTFSKLYRELLKGGPMSPEELNLILVMGKAFAIQKELEGFD
jgi:hypothetical protein